MAPHIESLKQCRDEIVDPLFDVRDEQYLSLLDQIPSKNMRAKNQSLIEDAERPNCSIARTTV
jgi:hypothetical protein